MNNYDQVTYNLMSLLLHEPKNFKDARLGRDMFPAPLDDLFSVAHSLYREGVKPTLEAIGVSGHPNAEQCLKIASQMIERGPPIVPPDKLITAAVKHMARLRILTVCRKFHDMASEDDVDVGQALTQFQGEAINIRVTDQRTALGHGSEFKSVNDRLHWRQQNAGKLRGPSTGYPTLDKMLDGLTPRYYIFGARPSVGKTAELCDITGALASEQEPCIVYSLEMPKDDYRERMLSAWSRVCISGYRDAPFTITELKAIAQTQKNMEKWPWWINDDPETSIADIETQCISHTRDLGKPTMVAIDYLQLVRIAGKKDKWELVAELSRRLKALGRNINCAIVALSQLKRTDGVFHKDTGRTMAKRPELQDLRESGDLEQDADVVQFIHRDVRHEPEKAEFILAKQRGGPTTDGIPMQYVPSLTTFKEA